MSFNAIMLIIQYLCLGFMIWIYHKGKRDHKVFMKEMDEQFETMLRASTNFKENHELLEALKEAREIIENEYGLDCEVYGPVIIKYDAIIHKAEG